MQVNGLYTVVTCICYVYITTILCLTSLAVVISNNLYFAFLLNKLTHVQINEFLIPFRCYKLFLIFLTELDTVVHNWFYFYILW